MRLFKTYLLLFLILLFQANQAQIKLCSWNLQNFGKSKTDSSIRFISSTLKEFDLVAIVEVVAGNGGAQAVARLEDELNRTGSKWDYCISDPTVSSPGRSERYAFLWKTSKLKKMGDAWLDTNYTSEIEREPFLGTFKYDGREFTLVTFHALPKGKKPETEIKYFKFYPQKYSDKTLIFCGDFNCPESHTVFSPLKSLGYTASLSNQKTTLKKECVNNNCLASEYDNIFYPSINVERLHSGSLDFYKHYPTLQEARTISDHLPIYIEFKLK